MATSVWPSQIDTLTQPSGTTPQTGHAALHDSEMAAISQVETVLQPWGQSNVKAYGATGNGTTDDTAAIQNAINAAVATGGAGVVRFPAGTFIVSAPLTLPNGITIAGAGTLKAASATQTGAIFQRVATSATELVEDIRITGLAIDCVAGPSGSLNGVYIDTSISAAIAIRRVLVDHVRIDNAYLGIRRDGNNGSAGPMDNQTVVDHCWINNCAVGDLATGTYAAFSTNNVYTSCTVAALGTGGTVPGLPTTAYSGQGPTAFTNIVGCHIEGLGNLNGSGTGQENGISIGASQGIISHCYVSNISRLSIAFDTSEGEGGILSDCVIWGSGYAGVYLSGGNSGQAGVCTNIVMQTIAQNPNAPSFESCGVMAGSGNWDISNVKILPGGSGTPKYAIVIGSDTPNGILSLKCRSVDCTISGLTSFWDLWNTQDNAIIKFSDCEGYNPVGPLTAPTVPASGTALLNPFYEDCTVYLSGGDVTAVQIGALLTPSPTVTTADTGGTLAGSTTFEYQVAALNAAGETLASAPVTVTTGSTTATSANTVAWPAVPGAASYDVYGRTSGSVALLANTTSLSYTDTGSVTPSGALPTANTTAPATGLTSGAFFVPAGETITPTWSTTAPSWTWIGN